MENENTKQLKILAEMFDTDKIITSDQIEQVLTGILGLLARFKKENQSLNDETKTQVESILEGISKEHDRILASVEKSTQNVKSEATEAVEKALERLKEVTKEVLSYKAKDGESPDQEKIIEEVLTKIKLPEYEIFSLDEKGENIVSEINTLPTNEDEYKIDASHIKNLPTPRGGYSPTVLGNATDLNQSARADGYAVVWDDTNKNFKFAAGGGGSGVTTMGAIGAAPNANGATITGVTLNLEPASASFGGVVTTGTQTFAGAKTFSNNIVGSAGLSIVGAGSFSASSAGMIFAGATTVYSSVSVSTSAGSTLATGIGSARVLMGTAPVTTFTSGTHPLIAGLVLKPQTITNAGATVTNTATLYVESEGSGGTNNYSGWFDAGEVRIDGDIGDTTNRVAKGWFTDLQVTNAITGSVTGNAGTASAVAVGGITGLGTGVATALAVNIGSAGAFVTFNGALGTPSSGTVTNLTGTASININGTVGATTPTTGSFTTVTTSGNIELGNASDTTFARAAAGIFSVEGTVQNGYATTATAAGTTTLTIASAQTQYFTGTSTQTVTLPTTSVLAGQTYKIENNSTSNVTVQSSGANTVQILGAGMSALFTALVATPTTAANWDCVLNEFQGLNVAQTASANAATVNLAFKTNTITNNSAATITITLPTAGAIDGEMRIVRVLDFSAVAQTITWVNTQNSTVTATATSNGSTTLPVTVGFQYNGASSLWRCIAAA